MREPKDIVINGKTLAEILEAHKHWLYEDCEDWQFMRADLRDADLRGAYFGGADLGDADLRGAKLRGADLRDADLRGAYFGGADLGDADLRGAKLRGADLGDADLRGAKLRGADLRDADLRGAKLRGVTYNERTAFFALQCPEEGSYIGWKRAGDYIVKLRITEDALRSSATTRKCRASKAEVLEIQNLDGTKAAKTEVPSRWDSTFIYKVGETVEVKDFDADRWNECSTGIHHFITRQEAVNY